MWDEDTPRLNVQQLEALAARRQAELLADGAELHPVCSRTRKLATRFWGSAWMKQLACCEAGGLCLAPGRTLLRHGCVLDVRVAPGEVQALVSARDLYSVELKLAPADDERCAALARLCAGRVDSLVSLLEGRLSDSLLQQLCEPESGLLPEAGDWRISCSCPDWAEPCPHAAAVMYALGVLLDERPELLFVLRAVEPEQLICPHLSEPQAFDAAKLGDVFGIEIDTADA